MTEEQEKQANEAFKRTSGGIPTELETLALVFFRRGFEAGQESVKEQPASICRGCRNYDEGQCGFMEGGIKNTVTSCASFLPVAFDEKEQSR